MFKHGIRVVIISIVLSALSGFLSFPAHGQEQIDLTLGGEGSTSWDIQQIKPGDSGTKTVELRNNGSRDGRVTIWITDIVSTEGVNPESETGDTSEPGELISYLMLGCSAGGLNTNIALPATIGNLPQNASDTNYITLGLDASETATLIWGWEFAENGQPQNDAQGDGLSFSIYYLLEEVPSEGISGFVDYHRVPPNYRQLEVDVLGEETLVSVDNSGRLVESLVVTDRDNVVQLDFERGTLITGTNGRVIRKMEMRAISIPVLSADDMKIIGEAYEIIGYTGDSVPSAVIFDRPVELKLGYNPDWLPENASSLFIATSDGNGNWQNFGGEYTVNEPYVLTAIINRSSVFAILAYLAPAEEATGVFTPIVSDPGEPIPVQSVTESPEIGSAAYDSPPSVTMTAPVHSSDMTRSYTITNADIIESWKRVSLAIMITGSAALIILEYFERRRHAYHRYSRA